MMLNIIPQVDSVLIRLYESIAVPLNPRSAKRLHLNFLEAEPFPSLRRYVLLALVVVTC